MDWPSGCSERHLSFVLRNLLSLDEVVFDEERQSMRDEARLLQDKAKNDLGDILQQIEPVSIGCEAQDLFLPHKYISTLKEEELTNFDMSIESEYMMVFKKLILGETVGDATVPDDAVCLMEPSGNPGYVKIRVPDVNKIDHMFHPFLDKERQGGVYFLGEETTSTLSKAMVQENPQLGLAVRPETGPQHWHLESDGSKKAMSISVEDYVVSLPCQSWPKAAEAFKSRRRITNWPSEDLVEKVMASGCHAVPGAHKQSKDPKIEWRLSFDVAEKELVESLTRPQRRCFLILAGLRKVHLDLPPVLTPYHIKTLLFWCLEEKPVETWDDEYLAPSLFFLLDKLIYFLVKRDLPDFFIPQNNLIGHVHREFIDDILLKVMNIRYDPVPYLRQIHDELQSPLWIPFDTIFAPLVCAIQDDPFYPGEDCIRHCLMNIGFGLSALGEKRHALPYLARCVRTVSLDGNDSPVYSIDTGLTQMIHHTALEVEDLDTAIKFMMFLVDIIGDVPPEDAQMVFDLPSILCNLGCLIHAKYHQETSEELKELLLAKAENFLLRGISSNLPSAFLEYANLLCRTNRENDAIFYLEKAATSSSEDALVQYGQMEKFNVDENLRDQIEIYGHVTLPSAVYATHQLILIHHKRGSKTEAQEYLAKLEKLVAVPAETQKRLSSSSKDMLEGIDEVDQEHDELDGDDSLEEIKLEEEKPTGGATGGKEGAGIDDEVLEDHEHFIQRNMKDSMSHIMSHTYKVVGMPDKAGVIKGGEGVEQGGPTGLGSAVDK